MRFGAGRGGQGGTTDAPANAMVACPLFPRPAAQVRRFCSPPLLPFVQAWTGMSWKSRPRRRTASGITLTKTVGMRRGGSGSPRGHRLPSARRPAAS